MARCDLFNTGLLSASSLCPLDHLFNSHQLPLSVVRIRLEKWVGGLGFPVAVFSLNDFMPSLWMFVSSSVSQGAGADDPVDPFQLGSV